MVHEHVANRRSCTVRWTAAKRDPDKAFFCEMLNKRPIDDVERLLARFERRDRAALSRLLTLAARGEIRSPLPMTDRPPSPTIAFTGSAGVGKSSLLGALAGQLAAQGKRIGILACDPESPLTGGALLGDRCRIAGGGPSERVFIRSLSTSSGGQGIAQNFPGLLQLIRTFGFDRVLIETVGAGQGDTAVRSLVDLVVLVVQPQTGDELQWEKAGILEIADVVVVNKGDLPGADRTVAELTEQLTSSDGLTVPVIKTSVARETGITELAEVIDALLAESDGR